MALLTLMLLVVPRGLTTGCADVVFAVVELVKTPLETGGFTDCVG